MKAIQGTSRLAFLGFFSSHIVFSFIIDGQAVFPKSLYPKALQDLLTWYATTLKDPLMSNASNILWFRSFVGCEMLFQVPFFFAACLQLSSPSSFYPEWFRYACIAYGSHTATTMVPILATISTNTEATWMERALLLSVYAPYLIFPLWILQVAVTSSSSTKAKST